MTHNPGCPGHIHDLQNRAIFLSVNKTQIGIVIFYLLLILFQNKFLFELKIMRCFKGSLG